MNMLNFNKLRYIVYEIFDNSQLFLTDPRKVILSRMTVCSLTIFNENPPSIGFYTRIVLILSNSTSYQIIRVSIENFRRVWHADMERTHSLVLFGTWLCSTC